MVTFNIFYILDKFQSGLFQCHFTETALLKLSSDLLKQENTGECIVLALLYPGAAFIVYCLTGSGIGCIAFGLCIPRDLTNLSTYQESQLHPERPSLTSTVGRREQDDG